MAQYWGIVLLMLKLIMCFKDGLNKKTDLEIIFKDSHNIYSRKYKQKLPNEHNTAWSISGYCECSKKGGSRNVDIHQ